MLREQVYIFAQLYRKGVQLSGIVYLHPITKNRVSGSSARNFRMLEKLCGPEGIPNIVLLSTMWDQIAPNSEEYWKACDREKELVNDEKFWGSMCKGGSKVRRFTGDKSSAMVVVDLLATNSSSRPPVKFQIQRELVDEGRDLLETSAARQIMAYLDGVLTKTQHDLEERATVGMPEEMETREELLGRRRDTEEAIFRLKTRNEDFYEENRTRFSTLLENAVQDQKKLRDMVEKWRLQCAKFEADNIADGESYLRELDGRQMNHKTRGKESQTRKEFELRNLEEQKRIQDKRLALEKATRSKKRKILLKQNIIPILQILGGATAIGVSVPFGIIPVAGAGVTILGAGLAALKFSTKDKSKPQDPQSVDDE